MKLIQLVGRVINVNARKEHHGEELVLACDVKVEVNCDREAIAQIDPTLPDHFWGEHGPKYPEFRYRSDREYERTLVKLNKIELKDAKVRKVEYRPEPGDTAKLTFTASVYPSQKTVGDLANLIQEDVSVNVEQTQVDLVDKVKADEGAGTGTANPPQERAAA